MDVLLPLVLVFAAIFSCADGYPASKIETDPAAVLVAFQQAYVNNDCKTLYNMLAPQPSGNWYANAAGPNSFTVLNRTNIVAICKQFSPPLADNAFLPLPAYSVRTYLHNHATIAFASLQGFVFNYTNPTNGLDPVPGACNVVWGDVYSAELNENGQIATMWEFYDFDDYQRKFQRCFPPPGPSTPATAPPPATAATATRTLATAPSQSSYGDLCKEFVTRYDLKQCSLLKGMVTSNFTIVVAGRAYTIDALLEGCRSTNKTDGHVFSNYFVVSNNGVMSAHVSSTVGVSLYGCTSPKRICSFMLPEDSVCDFTADSNSSAAPLISRVTLVYSVAELAAGYTSCGCSESMRL